MIPEIRNCLEKMLVGKRSTMSFSANKTVALWKAFMPRRNEIQNSIGTDLYSMQFYPPQFFNAFNPETVFEKWAVIEVSDFNSIPNEMESITLPAGLYAVFLYKGSASDAEPFYRYIHTQWLPKSKYILDNRLHFEILGAKYKNNDPDSEEEIWIPIKQKTNNIMENQPITIERVFNAPIAKVWSAITDKDEMKNWYFDLEEFRVEVGFKFQFTGGPKDGKQYIHHCEITAAIPEKKLTYSWMFEGYAGNSFVTWELTEQGNKTLLNFTHAGVETFPAANNDFNVSNFAEGWTNIINIGLKNYLEK